MPVWQVILIVGLFIAVDAVIVCAILFSCRGEWARLARGHDPAEPALGATVRRFQGFRIGMVNLGFSIHVATDEAYLHMVPTRFARWVGVTPVSVPWEHVQASGSGTRSRKAKINGVSLLGPAWCMSPPARGSAPPSEGQST